MEQQAGCNRRVQEVVRVKQRKKKIRIDLVLKNSRHRSLRYIDKKLKAGQKAGQLGDLDRHCPVKWH